MKALGDMGQTARLRIIRDRFIAGHDSCDLRRHLDSVSPETPIQDVVDHCRVWESHADSDARRFSKPGPARALPIYTVDDPGHGRDDRMVEAITNSPTAPDQLETLLRRLLPTPVMPTPPHRSSQASSFGFGTVVAAFAGGGSGTEVCSELASRGCGLGFAGTAGSHATGLGYGSVVKRVME